MEDLNNRFRFFLNIILMHWKWVLIAATVSAFHADPEAIFSQCDYTEEKNGGQNPQSSFCANMFSKV